MRVDQFIKNHRKGRPKARAFTLIEILIAVVAFAIVLAAINTVFYAALRLRNRSAEAIDKSRPVEQALNTIRRDLLNLALPGGVLAGSLQTTAMTNNVTGQVSPDFYTTTGLIDENSPWAEVQRIAYALVPSKDPMQGMDLVRVIGRNLLPIAVADPPFEQWLMSGVKNLVFTYYDGSQWRQSWDSTTADPVTGLTNTLPQAIKVEILLNVERNGPAFVAPLQVIVPMSVQPINLVAQQTSSQ